MMPRIQISTPVIGEEEKEAVKDVLDSGMLAQGEKVKEFEFLFADFIYVEHAVAVSSGTAALHIALKAHGIGDDNQDEVITTPFTFISTANAILFVGGKPVFADITEKDFNINPEDIVEKITNRTRAIIPVHLYGQPAEMKAIMEIAEDHKLIVIEDACQAHGAEYEGKKAGSFATGCFSFYPTKNMTTGEGGMITTNDAKVAELAGMIRNHGTGKRQKYEHEILGYNLRMTDISAAMGIAQLKRLVEFTKKRQENAHYLSKRLNKLDGIIIPGIKDKCLHVFHQYTIRVVHPSITRDKLAEALRNKGIKTGVYYPIPIHKQPLYRKLGYKDVLPVAEEISTEVLSLPVHPALKKEDLDYICDAIEEELRF